MSNKSSYIGIRQLLRELRSWRGYAMHPNRIHELIATKGLPAYRDELRKTPRYLFIWEEVRGFIAPQSMRCG